MHVALPRRETSLTAEKDERKTDSDIGYTYGHGSWTIMQAFPLNTKIQMTIQLQQSNGVGWFESSYITPTNSTYFNNRQGAIDEKIYWWLCNYKTPSILMSLTWKEAPPFQLEWTGIVTTNCWSL